MRLKRDEPSAEPDGFGRRGMLRFRGPLLQSVRSLSYNMNVAITRGGCEARVTRLRLEIGFSVESGCLKLQPKAGGKLHLRLNMTTRPIANKYREGKLKRTLKRELKSA